MSMFGDSRNQMNELYTEIKYFFENGGTLNQLFEILSTYFEYNELPEINKIAF